ncbi:hypothetical protein M422DRAFT_159439 [Sphaerobolus stellatus SS14]|nr:hypothetical protein M422DRAFT_159439 [Sphaerobolus stellatus SS14]
MRLGGIIYFGGSHFVSRIFSKENGVYFNDGLSTGRQCIYEGSFMNLSPQDLWIKDNKKAVTVIYYKTT